jgi:hypothetical protein
MSFWRSLRPPEDPAYAVKPSPVNLKLDILGAAADKVTSTATSSAFATEEDILTDEPDIRELNVAGYDPVELGATTFPLRSRSAASTASPPGELALGRRKLPTENSRLELAAISTLNVNRSSLELKS